MQITEKAYAKINLFLEIVGKRPDGYHNLSSVMQSVSLCDELLLETEPSDTILIELSCDSLPCDRSNLAYRAAEAYLEASCMKAVVKMHLEKHIPVAAGLGGGSADAAAVLRAMNKIYGRLKREEILRVAATLGADVPFCFAGGTMLCTGIGDIMTPVENRWNGWYTVARGDSRVSTPEAYLAIDANKACDGEPQTPDKLIDRIKIDGNGMLPLFNRFETVIEPVNPEIGDIKQIMKMSGSLTALMSGSGPSVFGLFASEEAAQDACCKIQARGWFASVCRNQSIEN